MSFRPLAGIKVSERIRSCAKLDVQAVFVPSRGSRHLNANFRHIQRRHGSFRPLAGIKVSEHQRQRLHLNQNRFRPLSGSKVSEPFVPL